MVQEQLQGEARGVWRRPSTVTMTKFQVPGRTKPMAAAAHARRFRLLDVLLLGVVLGVLWCPARSPRKWPAGVRVCVVDLILCERPTAGALPSTVCHPANPTCLRRSEEMQSGEAPAHGRRCQNGTRAKCGRSARAAHPARAQCCEEGRRSDGLGQKAQSRSCFGPGGRGPGDAHADLAAGTAKRGI